MDSEDYKIMTSVWNVKQRNIVEDTLALIESENSNLAEKLKLTLNTAPIEKPQGHTGGKETDFFKVRLSEDEAQEIIDLLFDLESGAVPQGDGLGFEKEAYQSREAWRIARLVDEWNKINTE